MSHPPSSNRHRRLRVPAITALALTLAVAFTLLIWIRLRLVTGVPRSVYAEPDRRLTEPQKPAPSSDDEQAPPPAPAESR
jgi:hypothetical protein